MSKRDVLLIGLKLLGVYFVVQGVATLLTIMPMAWLSHLSMWSGPGGFRITTTTLLELLPAAAELVAAGVLIACTEKCAGWVMRGEA